MVTPITNPIDNTGVSPTSSREAFAALDHAHQQLKAAEVAELIAIAHAADLYQVDQHAVGEGIERLLGYGHDGTPCLGEFLALEISGLLGISPQSAINRIGNVLDLRHRHPALWTAVISGKVRVWQANQVLTQCAHLSLDAVTKVDGLLAQGLAMLPWSRIVRALPGWITTADPALAAQRQQLAANHLRVGVSTIADGHVDLWGKLAASDGIAFDHALTQIAKTLPTNQQPGEPASLDLDRRKAAAVGILARQAFGQETLPTHTLVVHISVEDPTTGQPADSDSQSENLTVTRVALIEKWGALLTDYLPDFLSGSKVVVRPIIDPDNLGAIDSYHTPASMRFALNQRNPYDVFPYGTKPASACEADHTIPYTPNTPAQTHLKKPRATIKVHPPS